MNASRRVSLLFCAVFLFVFFSAQVTQAQCVSLTTLTVPVSEPFTALANAGTNVAWTDNSTIPGYYSTRTTYNAGTGSSNTGALYSFGVAGTNVVTDRALGGVGSGGTGTFYWAGCYTNNTGATITSLDISYDGEQWRDGGATTPVAQTMGVEYQVATAGTITDADTPTTGWNAAPAALNFTSPTFVNTTTGAALDGNAPANRSTRSATITVNVPVGSQFWIRWRDLNDGGNDHALAIDNVSVTPQGSISNAPVVPNCPTPITTTTGTATTGGVSATDADGTVTSATITGITPSDPGTITLTGFTPAGGVGGTANATVSVSAATPANTYTVTIQWANNDGSPQTASCNVSVVVNPPPSIAKIHDVQGNGAAAPFPGTTYTVEGIVTGNYQPVPNDNRLSGFFLQEEDADADADPATSEGIFVFCSSCPTSVAEGQRVQVTGVASEFFNNTQLTASTAGSVVITNAGNNLAQVTPVTIDLPVVGVINDFYERMENMLVTYVDTLTVSEYFEQARYGTVELFEGGRPRQFAEANAPSAAGYTSHLDNLNRRRVILDDDDNVENSVLNLPDGLEFVYHPRANGGLSVGTQGPDFFRGGDTVANLTGILHWSFGGGPSADEWRIRPHAATPATFTPVNTRPATAPAVGGAIKIASVNVLNYFTTLNVRGADSTAELTRQRDRVSRVLCGLNPDVAALMEIENHATNATITDLLGAVNSLCGGAHPFTFVNTGGALGTDEIRVMLIYRTGVVSPVGAPLVDMNAVHNRPPTAQTFDVVDATNPAFGQRFTALANHSKSKGCGSASGGDLDGNDGQACYSDTREAQANRLLTWVNGTVIPAAGDPDVIMLGDFNAYPQETSVQILTSGGYSDLEDVFLGANAYSYLFDGQIGHIDYAFASSSLLSQVTGAAPWHINSDENPLFDYNDEIKDGSAEQAFEEKPDGSALVPPRVLFQPASVYRASDHDPVLAGLFAVSDLAITKTDSPDPVAAGNNLTYTITVSNNGPDPATNASWTDTLSGVTFVSLSSVGGWSCTTPAVGATGTITCTNTSFAVGSAVFTLVTNVPVATANGTTLSNTATVTSSSAEGSAGNESATATTTVTNSANLSTTKTDSPDPVNAGSNITYTITVNNAGPSNADSASLSDTLPTGTTFVSLSSPGGWSCTTPAVGATGTVSCSNSSAALGNHVFTLVLNVDANVASGTVISNTATAASSTSDPVPGDESATATTTVATSADLAVTKTDSPDPVNAGANITYTITVTNNGPSNASTVSLSDTLPAGTEFISLSSPGGWSCTTPAVNSAGTVTCTNASMSVGSEVFTLVVYVQAATASGTVISNTASVSTSTTDPDPGNQSATATTTVTTAANLSVTKTDSPDPVSAGNNLTYTIQVTNSGPSNADVSWSDALPAGTTFVSVTTSGTYTCTTPAVGANGTVTCSTTSQVAGSMSPFTLVVNVAPSVAAGTVLSNTVNVTSSLTDPTPGNESATTTTTVATSADLSVTKSDSPDPVTAGTNLTYTITVNNAGASNASTVTLADTVPANTTFVSLSSPGGWSCTTPAVGATGAINCSIASLAPGSAPFTLVVNVNAGTADGTTLTNTATVASATSDPNPGNESATATTTVGSGNADLSVTKTDSPDPVTPGNNITYTITVNNAGPSNATSATLLDTIPAGTTFVSLSSPAGWSCTTPAVGGTGNVSCSAPTMIIGNAAFTLVVQLNPSASGGSVTNTVTVSSATTDPNPGNESATALTTIGAASVDLSVTKTDSPDPVTPGNNLTYTITVNNAGPSNASTLALSDTLPTGTTFVSLSSPGGWSCTTPAVGGTGAINCTIATLAPGNALFTLVVNVGSQVATGTILSNTATVTSATTDPNPGNESSTATTTVGAGSADLSVTKTDSPDPVNAGSNITYTITVNNAGSSNATSASLTDTIPANTTFVSLSSPGGWSCTTPAVGGTGNVSCTNASMTIGSAVFTLVVNVNAGTANGTVITNTATASSSTTDPNPGNESATATTTVSVAATSADLSVTKTDSPDPVAPGGNITYTITVTNSGPDAAASASLSDNVPTNTTFVSLSAAAGWSCTTPAAGATGLITCTNASMAAGSGVFTLVVNVNAGTANGTVITNAATVTSATTESNPGNETATATTTVNSAATGANVTGTKTASGTRTPGSTLTYTITLTNSGPGAQADNPGNEFIDVLPAQLTLVSASASSGTAVSNVGTNTVTWNGPIPAGGTVTITIQAIINPAATPGTTITNQGTINYDADGNGTNEASNVTDDPGAAGGGNSTAVVIVPAATGIGEVPALDAKGLLALAALLAALGVIVMRRS